MAKLTAIICNYNHGRLVGRAIEAMVSQSRPPDELIVVDDGSTDESRSVIETWSAKCPFLRFLQNEKNLGFHASASRALAEARGDYIYSGAADDQVLPGFFQAMMSLCEQYPQAGIACGQMVTALPDGNRLRVDGFRRLKTRVYVRPEDFQRECLEAEAATHSLSAATIYRLDALKEVGLWRRELGSWCDTFSIHAIGLRHGMCFDPREVVMWYVNPGSLSQTTATRPERSLEIMRCASALMRSEEFAKIFPEDYVRRWETRWLNALADQQLRPFSEGVQAVRQQMIENEASSHFVARWILRFAWSVATVILKISYRVMHRNQRRSLKSKAEAGTTTVRE